MPVLSPCWASGVFSSAREKRAPPSLFGQQTTAAARPCTAIQHGTPACSLSTRRQSDDEALRGEGSEALGTCSNIVINRAAAGGLWPMLHGGRRGGAWRRGHRGGGEPWRPRLHDRWAIALRSRASARMS